MRCIARLSVLAAIGLSTACSQGQGSSTVPQTFDAAVRQSASQNELFVSNETKQGAPVIYIYPAGTTDGNPSPIGSITDGLTSPRGLAVDTTGDLFVANDAGSSSQTRCYGCIGFVGEYAAGTKKLAQAYTDGISGSTNVLVGSDGRMYVSQIESVVEFPKGSTIPDRAIYLGQHTTATGLALDSNQNLYVAFDDATGIKGNVEFVKYGAEEGTLLNLNVHTPVGAGVDGSGNLLVSSSVLDHGGVGVFAAGSKNPSQTIKGKMRLPQFISLDSQHDVLYVADSASGKVDEFSYPAGQLIGTVASHLQQPFGVALFEGASR
jgi:hypothetical protein